MAKSCRRHRRHHLRLHPLLAVDEAFDVEIETQPTGASAPPPTPQRQRLQRVLRGVTCASNPYTLGGTVKGLSGTGLVLANGNDTVAVPAPATGADVSFTFPTTVGDGSLLRRHRADPAYGPDLRVGASS
jgi:hypothetical protein